MKVIIDTDKCQGHARCHAICPELFELDSIDQKSRVKLPIVPAELEGSTRRAVNECPEGALSIELQAGQHSTEETRRWARRLK